MLIMSLVYFLVLLQFLIIQQRLRIIMQSLNQKQEYLSKEILEKGYDPEDFQDFMIMHSDRELDLNVWTIEDLKKVVGQFKRKKDPNYEQAKHQIQDKQVKQQYSHSKKQSQLEQQCHQEIDEINMTQIRKSIKKLDQMQDSKALSPTVNSSLYRPLKIKKKLQLPQLYLLNHVQKKPFAVTISNYTKTVPNNIFKSTYIQYIISTTEMWQTKRRFTDFVWLHSYLKHKYCGCPIPPIPQKTTLRSFDQKHVFYRMMMFQRFLNVCVQTPQICSDLVLQIFLRGSQQYFSQTKKKLQEKLCNNPNSNEIESIYGEDLILVEKFTVQPQILNFYKQYSSKLTNLGCQLNILLENIKKVSAEIHNIEASFGELSALLQSKLKGFPLMTTLKKFCNNFSSYMQKTESFIKNNIYEDWNYQTMYVTNIVSNITKFQKQQLTFTQKFKNSFKNIILVEDESDNNGMERNRQFTQCQTIKQLYRIKLSYIIRQINRYQEYEMKSLAKRWVDGMQGYIKQSIMQWMMDCTDSLTQGMGVVQGKKLVEVEYIKK